MTDSENTSDGSRPPRRPRYAGKNPRQFHEKYKELQPEKYPEDVAKVLAGGKTPAGMHRPIMVAEILEVLAPKPGEAALDCTLGYGGHARELLAAVQPLSGGRLLGIEKKALPAIWCPRPIVNERDDDVVRNETPQGHLRDEIFRETARSLGGP